MSKEIFSEIAKEIETGQLDAALWTEAFAECDGDHDKAKALYIRLRRAELETNEVQAPAQKQEMQSDAVTPATRSVSELVRIRGALQRLLTLAGKSSLYSHLKLSPQCGDEDIRHVIDAARSRQSKGEVLPAETEYAIAELGEPTSREAYDRRLFLVLMNAQNAETNGVISNNASRDSSLHWVSRKVLVLIAIGTFLLLGLLSLGFLQTKVAKDIGTGVVANQREAIQATKESDSYRAATERSVGSRIVDNEAQAIAHSAQIANRREDAVEKQIEHSATFGTAQIEIEKDRLAEQKKQAAWQREQREHDRVQRTLDNLLMR